MPEEDKIHPPTPRRRRRAKSRGHVVKSIEVNSAVMLAGSVPKPMGCLFYIQKDAPLHRHLTFTSVFILSCCGFCF